MEYALILALIAVVAIGSLLFLGGHVKSDLSNAGTQLGNPAGLNGNGGNGGGNGNGNGGNGGGGNGGGGGGNGNGH